MLYQKHADWRKGFLQMLLFKDCDRVKKPVVYFGLYYQPSSGFQRRENQSNSLYEKYFYVSTCR